MTPRRRLKLSSFSESGSFLASSTMGRAGLVRSCSSSGVIRQIRRAASRERHIRARGFSARCFRSRSRLTASASRALQARWMPPIPFTARIPPPARSFWEERKASSPSLASRFCSRQKTWGPHSGQQSGCA